MMAQEVCTQANAAGNSVTVTDAGQVVVGTTTALDGDIAVLNTDDTSDGTDDIGAAQFSADLSTGGTDTHSNVEIASRVGSSGGSENYGTLNALNVVAEGASQLAGGANGWSGSVTDLKAGAFTANLDGSGSATRL